MGLYKYLTKKLNIQILEKKTDVIHQQLDVIVAHNEFIEKQNEVTRQELGTIVAHNEFIEKQNEVTRQQLDFVTHKILEIESYINSNLKIFTSSPFEYTPEKGNINLYVKCFWDEFFIKSMEGLDFKECYREFIEGFDENSVEIIVKELRRVFNINSESSHTNIFTQNEEKNIFNAFMKLKNNKIKLDQNCYAYKDYFLPLDEFEISTFVYNYGLDSINKKCIQGKDFIDAGAYIGDSSIVFARELQNHGLNKIHAFEPAKDIYNNLLKTIELNKFKNIIPINCALGEKNCELELKDAGMSSTFVENSSVEESKKEVVKVITLDDYVRENNVKVGIIKTDLEGYEKYFLKGAIETIKTQKPTLMISIYHSAKDYFNIKKQINDLKLGYKFSIFKADDGYIVAGTLLICEIV